MSRPSEPMLLSDLIVAGAERDSSAEAVRSGDGEMTYEELAGATDLLASVLQSLGVNRGDRVGVYLHKSVTAFAAIHGVLRAGAAFVPIDPFAPPGAVATIIEDCGIEVLVSEDRLHKALRQLPEIAPTLRAVIGPVEPIIGLHVVTPDAILAAEPARARKILMDDLAYVMYTSGSTGQPKGLMHTHASGLRYAQLASLTYGLRPDDKLANSAPFHFDISTFELFAGPLAGATSLVIPEPYLKLPASLSQLVADEQCTFWYSVPFLLAELLMRGALDERDLSSLRWVLFGGEVADPEMIAKLMTYMSNARFSNSYGPAEVNQCMFFHLPGPPSRNETIPIGRPWSDADLRIVDNVRRPVPPGEVGELLVRTSTMMAGYWGRDDLNAKAFVHTELAGGRKARWYATGDLVRELPTGEHEFLGRRDHQVKVRGNRVELEAVESILVAVDGIEHAIAGVVEVEDTTALVAGVTIDANYNVDLDRTLEHVASLLPPYAVPFRLVVLGELPLTGSGKIDRRQVRTQLADQIANPFGGEDLATRLGGKRR